MSGAWPAATIACAFGRRSASGTTWYSTGMLGCCCFHSARMSSYAFCSFMPPATWPMKKREMFSVVSPPAGWAAPCVEAAGASAAGLLSAGLLGAGPEAGAGLDDDVPQAATSSAPKLTAPSLKSERREHARGRSSLSMNPPEFGSPPDGLVTAIACHPPGDRVRADLPCAPTVVSAGGPSPAHVRGAAPTPCHQSAPSRQRRRAAVPRPDRWSVRCASVVCGCRTDRVASAPEAGKAMLAHMSEAQVDAILARGMLARAPNTITEPTRLKAQLWQVTQRGYALDEENLEGVGCVASPVLNLEGRLAGGISLSAPSMRVDNARLLELATVLNIRGRSYRMRAYHDQHRRGRQAQARRRRLHHRLGRREALAVAHAARLDRRAPAELVPLRCGRGPPAVRRRPEVLPARRGFQHRFPQRDCQAALPPAPLSQRPTEVTRACARRRRDSRYRS
jgi:hypothetical protein